MLSSKQPRICIGTNKQSESVHDGIVRVCQRLIDSLPYRVILNFIKYNFYSDFNTACICLQHVVLNLCTIHLKHEVVVISSKAELLQKNKKLQTEPVNPPTLNATVNTDILNEAHGHWIVLSNFPVPQEMVCKEDEVSNWEFFQQQARWQYHWTLSSANVSSPGFSSVDYGQRMLTNFEEFAH